MIYFEVAIIPTRYNRVASTACSKISTHLATILAYMPGFACPASLVVWGAAVGDEQKEATRLVRDLHEHAGRLALGSPIRPGAQKVLKYK